MTEASEELPAQGGLPRPRSLTCAWGLNLPLASSVQEQARQAHVGVHVRVPRVSRQRQREEGP